MGPKISEAKTPPLRKPASLSSLPSSTQTPLPFSSFSLLLNTSLSHMHKISVLPTSACSKPLWKICISVLFPLSACSKFKHAYGGRMCLWSPCAFLWRVLLCLSLSLSLPLLRLFFYLSAAFFLSSLHLTLFLAISLPYISLSYLSANPNIIVTHTNVETQDRQACMNEHTNAYARGQTTMLMHT